MNGRVATAIALATVVALTLGFVAGAQPTPKPEAPSDLFPQKKGNPGELVMPPGIYTSIVVANTGGPAATVVVKAASGSATVVVPGNSTVVVPLGQGWQLGQQGTVTFSSKDVIVSGITTSGPVKFEPEKK
jgi:hypothetical protein